MSEQRVTFKFQDLTLAGVVRIPDGVGRAERRPAFMFAGSNARVRRIVQDWLADYFPVAAEAAAA
jgi:hypothetical protein